MGKASRAVGIVILQAKLDIAGGMGLAGKDRAETVALLNHEGGIFAGERIAALLRRKSKQDRHIDGQTLLPTAQDHDVARAGSRSAAIARHVSIAVGPLGLAGIGSEVQGGAACRL